MLENNYKSILFIVNELIIPPNNVYMNIFDHILSYEIALCLLQLNL
jgi:hypothetical protein